MAPYDLRTSKLQWCKVQLNANGLLGCDGKYGVMNLLIGLFATNVSAIVFVSLTVSKIILALKNGVNDLRLRVVVLPW